MNLFHYLILFLGFLAVILLAVFLDKFENFILNKEKPKILTFDEYLIKNALYLQAEIEPKKNFEFLYFKETLFLEYYFTYLIICGISEEKLRKTDFISLMLRSKTEYQEWFSNCKNYKDMCHFEPKANTPNLSKEIELILKSIE